MPVVHAESVAAARHALAGAASPVVVIPVHNGFDDTVRCYRSVLAHTPVANAVLVVDDAGADRRPIDILDAIAGHAHHTDHAGHADHLVVVLHRTTNGGFVRACNDAFAATAGCDVVVLNSDCVVGPGWLHGLTDAAASSSLIATVTALTNHGSIVSVPHRNVPTSQLPASMDVDRAAGLVAAASLRLRPTLPTAVGHCMLIRRMALDLVGGFDEAFGTGYGEEVDFCQRAVQFGLRHVCADDVFVYHRGGGSFGTQARAQQDANEAIINARYPGYRARVVRAESDEYSPLAQAIERARVALTGMIIGIDALSLGPHTTGTQVVAFETIGALARQFDGGQIVVFHGPWLSPVLADAMDALPNTRREVVFDLEPPTGPMVDVLYRPCQVNRIEELRWLKATGIRTVVNQLDTIAFNNPTYFATDDHWRDYRDLTRLVLASVDAVAFISEAAHAEVDAEQLVPASTPTRVVWCGTGPGAAPAPAATRPHRLRDDDRPFLLAVGASFHHKNRVFSLRVLAGLRHAGWDGRLVLCGPTPERGDSGGSVAAELLANADLDGFVVDLADVTEADKQWLYANAALSLYPSTTEGFGLVPFESAAHGVPVLVSRQASLAEVLPDDIAAIDGYDVDQAVAVALGLLGDPAAAQAQCDRITARAGEFTWDRTASEVLALIDEVRTRPRNPVMSIRGEASVVGVTGGPIDAASPALAVGRGLEFMVQAARQSGGVKRIVSPDGSQRQVVVRRVVNWGRRTTGLPPNL